MNSKGSDGAAANPRKRKAPEIKGIGIKGRDADVAAVHTRKRKALELLEHRKGLPIWSARKKLVQCIQDNDTVILVGETGSGKTTQAPQLLYQQKAVEGCIACTQPRRVAAITVARRVAEESGVQLGAEVGYSVRFDDTSSDATKVKYMTDGMLIREAILDPRMLKYSVVFLDEAHERTVNMDVLMGLLKAAQSRRAGGGKPLKLVIMSATLDYEIFAGYYPNAQTAFVQGRQFPVEILYTAQPQDSYVQAAINAVLQVRPCRLTPLPSQFRRSSWPARALLVLAWATQCCVSTLSLPAAVHYSGALVARDILRDACAACCGRTTPARSCVGCVREPQPYSGAPTTLAAATSQ